MALPALTTVRARTVFAPLDEGGRAGTVARRLAQAITLGLLLDGERLPAETQLAGQFGVSPVTLREALAELREAGLVETRRGRRGGSFIRARRRSTRPRSSTGQLRQLSLHELRDIGDHRAAVAGAAARLAAQRALAGEVATLREHVGRLRAAGTLTERRRADARIHIEIAAVAQSPRLTREEMDLWSEVGDLVWLPVTGGQIAGVTGEHDALVEAIGSRTANGRGGSPSSTCSRRPRDCWTCAWRWGERHRGERRRGKRGGDGGRPRARLLADVTRRMEQVLSSVAGIVTAAESIAGAAGQPPDGRAPSGPALRRDDFAATRPLVAGLLREHAGLAAGAGVVLAPHTVADAPRAASSGGGPTRARGIVPLEVDLDPESAEFYDYTTTEWYREPERTGAPTLAGPYVDFICTHEYTFTLAAPVRRAGRFIGVAAADILATQVERLVLPGLSGLGLAELGCTAVLASAHGRVIASTSASLPPGVALPRGPRAAGFVPLAGPGLRPPASRGQAAGRAQAPDLLPWRLLAVPAA